MNYSEKVKKYFHQTKHHGQLIAPFAKVFKAKSHIRGYEVELYFKLNLDHTYIEASRFLAYGDPSIIATLAWFCEYAEKRTCECVSKIKVPFIIESMQLDTSKRYAATLIQSFTRQLEIERQPYES